MPVLRQRIGRLLAVLTGSLANVACSGSDPAAELRLPPEMNRTLASPHFVVHTDFAAEPAEHHRRVLEGMFAWFEQNWLPVPPQPEPLRVLLFADSERMRAWNEQWKLSPAMGRYLPEANLLVIDLETGLGTAFHELVHYCLHGACTGPRTPFVEEGVAAFFEKFLGCIGDDGRLDLTVGYFSPWRFMLLQAKYESMRVPELWAADGAPDYEVARSFMLFLHHQGHLLPFVRALRTATGDGRQELEAITGRTLPQLDADWHTWVAAQPFAADGDVFLVDRAKILRPAEWQQWQQDNEKRLVFDAAQRRWRVRN